MPILSIFDLNEETVICFGKFLQSQKDFMEFSIKNGLKVPEKDDKKYNTLTISNDRMFVYRYHLEYFVIPHPEKLKDRSFMLDVNPFMMKFGFMYLYIWFIWFYSLFF
jgi:hypothetical protein